MCEFESSLTFTQIYKIVGLIHYPGKAVSTTRKLLDFNGGNTGREIFGLDFANNGSRKNLFWEHLNIIMITNFVLLANNL